MGMKKWVVSDIDKSLAKELANECGIDTITALIASSRGYTDPCELDQFLSDEPIFSDPYSMADITLASDIIKEAIEKKEKIAVFGDYDCDGVAATTLLYSYLRECGADAVYYIPNRFAEGYGMNCEAVKQLHSEGVKLIVTVDNGIACLNEVKLAKELGMRVVVTDHHLPGDTLPDADAVVDPYRPDCESEFKTVCGAEVAFRLICVIENKEPEELLYKYADLLTVAVIADIMPLTLENRSIVKCGLLKLKEEPTVGLYALMNIAGIDKEKIDSGKVTFGICPRINAAGRMGDATRAVKLLLSGNTMEALAFADEIDRENSERQCIEKQIFADAVRIIEDDGLYNDRVIVAAGENWNPGVVGIVASRIVEKYGCPAILLSVDGEYATGSGRSIDGFSLFDAISFAKDYLEKFGGHSAAAGITVKVENINEVRQKINEYAGMLADNPPLLKLDCKLNPSALSLDLAYSISALEPFGAGNKVPLFGVFGVRLDRITPIGNDKHLRLLFTKGENTFQALLFGVSSNAFCFCLGDILDLAVTVDVNNYKGNDTASVQIKAIRMSGTDDGLLFKEIFALKDFLSGNPYDKSLLLPSREEVGTVYKDILSGDVSEERLKYKYVNTVGFGKTEISLMVLKELGFVVKDNSGIYSAVKNAKSNSIANSVLYRKLLGGENND